MNHAVFDANDNAMDPLKQCFHVELTRMEMAVIIEALLQAEMTLPLLDRRYLALKPVESLRHQQLSLATRLEDSLAGVNRWQERAHHHPVWASPWRSTQPCTR